MTTRVQEENPYSSSGTSSKKHSTNHSLFCRANTLEKIGADKFLLAAQQLASENNSAKFNNNIYRNSKLPKSLNTTMPTFDGKSQKTEMLEDLFQAHLKFHNQLTEEDKINCFHSLMRVGGLRRFKNISSPNRENLGDSLTVFLEIT